MRNGASPTFVRSLQQVGIAPTGANRTARGIIAGKLPKRGAGVPSRSTPTQVLGVAKHRERPFGAKS